MLLYIVAVLVSGLIVGALGRLVIPGPNPMGFGATLAVGIGGSLLGGLAGRLLLGRPGGLLFAVAGRRSSCGWWSAAERATWTGAADPSEWPPVDRHARASADWPIYDRLS